MCVVGVAVRQNESQLSKGFLKVSGVRNVWFRLGFGPHGVVQEFERGFDGWTITGELLRGEVQEIGAILGQRGGALWADLS